MAAVIPPAGNPGSTTSASCGSRYRSWPAKLRRYCTVQIIATCSWVLAVLWWILLDSGAGMLAATALTTASAIFVAPVLADEHARAAPARL